MVIIYFRTKLMVYLQIYVNLVSYTKAVLNNMVLEQFLAKYLLIKLTVLRSNQYNKWIRKNVQRSKVRDVGQ
jgi:hypothetical protein